MTLMALTPTSATAITYSVAGSSFDSMPRNYESDDSIVVRGLTLEEVWALAASEEYEHEGRIYIPVLSFLEEGTHAVPVLRLVHQHEIA